ncbi:MAG: cyclic nucleotide-binding domain-containing protein [Acidobacteriota bacterium]
MDWFVLGAGVAALAVTLGLLTAISSRFVRSRLRFAAWLFLAFLILELAVSQSVGSVDALAGIARLVFALAVITVGVALLVNPWRHDRPSEAFPAIVQDVLVIGLFLVTATLLMREQLLTTSAVGAVVVGFALQDTLGNLFAGLAIQIERPFRVGHWIAVGDREGQVQEITWRATKLQTKAGQFLIVPNSVIGKEAILNFSEPTAPTRLMVEVGASYLTPPNVVRGAIREALGSAPLVLAEPEPSIVLHDFGASALIYRVRFWIADYALDQVAMDQVRTNIWYTFRRHDIEIPWPIQVEYKRQDLPARTEADVRAAIDVVTSVDLFAPLGAEGAEALARGAAERLYAAGEAVVRQGEAGTSMFVVVAGRVRVVLEPSGQEVAVVERGGLIGEMSMLTGDPRTATVRAIEDARLLEISADQFRALALERPEIVEQISRVVEARRGGLDAARAARSPAVGSGDASQGLLRRIQRFLRLPG